MNTSTKKMAQDLILAIEKIPDDELWSDMGNLAHKIMKEDCSRERANAMHYMFKLLQCEADRRLAEKY